VLKTLSGSAKRDANAISPLMLLRGVLFQKRRVKARENNEKCRKGNLIKCVMI